MSKQLDVLRAPVPRLAGYLSTSPTKAYELIDRDGIQKQRSPRTCRIFTELNLIESVR